MSKRSIIKIAYIFITLVILASAVVLIPVAPEDTFSAEKRELAEFPKISYEFSEELEAYLVDHMVGRSALTSLYNYLDAKLFKTSTQSKVVIGKGDWMFFGETTADYSGANQWSDERLDEAVTLITELDEALTEQGVDFAFVIAPNKNSVYPEYMPYYIRKSGGAHNGKRLVESLQKKGVFAPNLYDLLADAKEEEQVYHKTDSHWNRYGAELAAELISGKKMDYLSENTVEGWRGDLVDLIYPAFTAADYQNAYEKNPDFTYTYRFQSEDDLVISTKSDSEGGRLVMYRDSFGRALYPFLAAQYSEAVFLRATPYDFAGLREGDFVVIEIAERNLEDIFAFVNIDSIQVEKRQAFVEADENATEITASDVQENLAVDINEQIVPAISMNDTLRAQCEKILDDILAPDMTQREKAYAIYKWAETNVRYSGNTPTDDWQESALLTLQTGKGNCYGFYSVSRALLTLAGFENEEKHFSNYGHFWNYVKMDDGCWYHFDTTTGWGGERFLLDDAQMAAYSTSGGLSYDWEGGPVDVEATSVRVGDKVISLDMNITEVTALLGEATSYQESKSCLYDGYDKSFHFGDVKVDTYPVGDQDYVKSITINNPSDAIAQNLRVGDSRDAIIAVMGDRYSSGGESFIAYDMEGYGYAFYFLENVTSSIEIYK